MKENFYIDQYGKPYVENESMPAGGGLDRRCKYNADALFAFYAVGSRDKIHTYLRKRGFILYAGGENYEDWRKGNTIISFESYLDGLWGYVSTELIKN